MSPDHPEMTISRRDSAGIQADISAITDINMEFLRLLSHPATREMPRVLGLAAEVVEGLRQMTPEQQRVVAHTPLLLAEFTSISDSVLTPHVSDAHYSPVAESAGWAQELHGFADRLLVFLWQASRSASRTPTVCMGVDKQHLTELAALSFTKISRSSRQIAGCLKARLACHPSYWNDLIRTVRGGSDAQCAAARLAIIQLSVRRQAATAIRPARRRHYAALLD
jgi:hypothetical protein